MDKQGSTTFLVTKVAKSSLIIVKTLEHILELEKKVLRLWYHMAVLLKRNHRLKLRVEELMEEADK